MVSGKDGMCTWFLGHLGHSKKYNAQAGSGKSFLPFLWTRLFVPFILDHSLSHETTKADACMEFIPILVIMQQKYSIIFHFDLQQIRHRICNLLDHYKNIALEKC